MEENYHLSHLLSQNHNPKVFSAYYIINMAFPNNDYQQQLVDVKKTTSLAPKSKRSVSFSPSARGVLTIHRSEYTDEERAACWYSKNDFQGFKTDASFTVSLLETKRDIGEKHYCKRGLETWTRAGAKFLLRNKVKAYRAVFQEQILQDVEGPNEMILSAVYQEASQQAKLSAYLAAVSDEKEARGKEETATADMKKCNGKSQKRNRSFVRTCRRHLPLMRFSSH